MNNKITIDINEIRKAPNESIYDSETIRQLSLYIIDNPGNNDLADKINPKMYFAALYPHAHNSLRLKNMGDGKFSSDLNTGGLVSNFVVYNPIVADKITKDGINYLNNLKDKLDD